MTGYAHLNEHNRQQILSYLTAFELLQVAATNKANRKLITDNCYKYIMRMGHPVRRLKINLRKIGEFEEGEELPLILRITD